MSRRDGKVKGSSPMSPEGAEASRKVEKRKGGVRKREISLI